MLVRCPRVLVIGEPKANDILNRSLSADGYKVIHADTGISGLESVANLQPDAVILDIDLRDMDGLDVLRRTRGFYKGPVLVVSEQNMEHEKVKALDIGADDYVEKPIHAGEFLARLRVAIRNHFNWSTLPVVVKAGTLEIDLLRRLVFRAGTPVRLSPLEYEVLERLVEGKGQAISHQQLLTSVWGAAHAHDIQYLRVFVGHLRRKLEANPSSPKYLLTEGGFGYRFITD
jgi:two-component system KDP operon response regulator KdpE